MKIFVALLIVSGVFMIPITAKALTMNFDAGINGDPAYTEGDLTVSATHPTETAHLHFGDVIGGDAGNNELYSHINCVSFHCNNYEFTNANGLWDFNSLLIGPCDRLPSSDPCSATGGHVVLTSDLGHSFDLIMNRQPSETFVFDWLGITTLTWNISGNGALAMDDLVYTNIDTTPVPEPGTLILLGSGLVGMLGFRTKIRKNV